MSTVENIKDIDSDSKTIGIKQSVKALEENRVEYAYVAKDADSDVIDPIIEMCNNSNVHIIYVDTMKELGAACGIDVDASVACILKSC